MTQTDILSDLFRVLSHPHRRVVLYYLREHETASLDALAACVTGWDESGPGAATSTNPVDYERVRIQLHHTHLPMLADAGFVTYDVADEEVTLGDLLPPVEDVVSTAAGIDTGEEELDLDALVASSEN